MDLSGRWDGEARVYVPNGLSGPIPPALGSLANLTELNLRDNQLTGPIPPELGNLAKLTGLHLERNQLTGPIPSVLANLASLSELYLASNRLSGAIPPELGNLSNLTVLTLSRTSLSGEIPAELGSLANLVTLQLWATSLSGPIPPELGNLDSAIHIRIGRSNVSGPVPPELGNLTNLQTLELRRNRLTGPIPKSLLQLDRLQYLGIGDNATLCVAGTGPFASWLRKIPRHDAEGVGCNAADLSALKQLYEAASGADWIESAGWSSDGPVEDWHGVTADSLGRVTALDLTRNGLAGHLPGSLPHMARMTELRIGGNPDLSGRLPLSLAKLPLRVLNYAGTGLCAPEDASFQAWLDDIASHDGTGAECPPMSDREILEVFHEAAGGRGWVNSDNWRTDRPLGTWHGVDTDGEGRVVSLRLRGNGISGSIPSELGGLARLGVLSLDRNDLTGAIPAELGNLANLRTLSLVENDLTGPIPAELGGLTNLFNVSLGRNDLTGAIPPELGNLADLRWLELVANRLTGSIPPELSRLARLEVLYLGDNELTGPVPPALGGLVHLRHLALQANAGMSGSLPGSLTNLALLETLLTAGTGLCAPSDPGFLDWLEGVASRQVGLCGHEPAMAYLVQAVQSREFPVPLVADREALLRVFVTAGHDNDERLPPVRASFYLNGILAHVAEIAGKAGPIPTQVDEGSLEASANAVVPAEVIQPGLEMVVEVDLDGTLDSGLGVARRIPDMGRATVDVRAVPPLDLTLVPFLWTEQPDSAIVAWVDGVASNPAGDVSVEWARTLLPIGDLTVTAHEPVLSSSNNAYDLVAETRAIRVIEGGTGYYQGMMMPPTTGAWGLGYLGQPVSFSTGTGVDTHELGHNMSLLHAPCSTPDPDPAYPYPDGNIGAWGYDFADGVPVHPSRYDIMGYCGDRATWISDYHFSRALHHRLRTEGAHDGRVAARASSSLLLWGGADSDDELHLNPAFVVDAPPVLPRSGGQHRITGRTTNGSELFSFGFAMPETADGNGSSSFAFVLPVQPGWEEHLASITLSGPGGSFTLDGESDLSMAILRNPRTGQIRGILRDPLQAMQAAGDGGAGRAADLEVLFSRGIPGPESWRR